MKNLCFDYCYLMTDIKQFIDATGIKFLQATPQTMGDCIWLWGCTNVPEPLPERFAELMVNPHDAVGFGLSQEMADEIFKLGSSELGAGGLGSTGV